MTRLVMRGDERVLRFLQDLPVNLDRELTLGNIEFLKRVKKSAKLRIARSRMSGELSDSIVIMPTIIKGETKQMKLAVLSPYGIYQEEGYKGHWVHALMPTKNRLGTIGDVYDIAGFMWVKKSEGLHFMRDAVEKQLSTFAQKLNKAVGRAIEQ